MRFLLSGPFKALLLAILVLPTAPLPGQGDPTAPVREKVYYVPFDELGEVFEAADRGIFLPYQEFLELWQRAEGRSGSSDVRPPAPTVVRRGDYRGEVIGELARLEASFVVDSLQDGWTSTPLPLGRIALESGTIRHAPGEEGGEPGAVVEDALFFLKDGSYTLLLPDAGTYQLDLRFSVPVQSSPGRKMIEWSIPPLAVSRLELSIPETETRVEVSPAVATSEVETTGEATALRAFLGDSGAVSVTWMPPVGRAAAGGAIVSAHQEALATLDARVLRVASVLQFSVLRGEVDTFRVALPAGLQLIAVEGDNVKEWRPEEGVLTVSLHAPVSEGYRLRLELERILEQTPPSLALPFPSARDVQRESGTIVLEHDSGLRVRVTERTRLSQLDPEEVPGHLRGPGRIGFSYLEAPAALTLAVETIEPRLRTQTASVVVLGTEEDAWIGTIDASVRAAGIFQLAIRIPAGWEVESIGDPRAVEEYRTVDDEEGRTITVNLRSRALGNFSLPFRFVREGSARPGELSLVAPRILGSEQDRGLLGVSGPRAIEIVTLSTEELLEADVDELFSTGLLGRIGSEASIPRAFRYRKHPARATLSLSERRTELDLLSQHLLEVGDGEVRVTHLLDYDILYAAVDALRFRAPSELDELLSVEVEQKTQVRRIASEDGMTTWEVGLQPPALGPLTVTIRHSAPLPITELEAGIPLEISVPLIEGIGARSTQGFVAIRKEGALEVAGRVQEMEAIDAGDLPDKLRRGRIAASYRYFDEARALSLVLTRYDLQPLVTAVVSLMHLRTVISEGLEARTEATIWLQNGDRQFIEVELPPGAQLLNVVVNGEREAERRRPGGSGLLVEVPRSAGPAGTFPVVLNYERSLGTAMKTSGRISLETPSIGDGIPVQEIELDLHLPSDHHYLGWEGNLHRRQTAGPGSWERFKRLIGLATPTGGTVGAGGGERARAPTPLSFELDTEGTVHERFQTLSPRGELRFRHFERRIFSLLDFLLFLASAGLGLRFLRRREDTQVATFATLVLLALAGTWFADGPLRSLASSILGGVIVAGALLLLRAGRARLAEARRARLRRAPDPFIEEALPAGEAPRGADASAAEGGDAEEGR